MNKKIVLSLFCILAFHQASAQDGNMSKDELIKELSLKEEQHELLGKRILELQKNIFKIRKNAALLIQMAIKKNKANPEQLDLYASEIDKFVDKFLDYNQKKDLIITKDESFRDFLDLEDAVVMKFFLIKKIFDVYKLKSLINQWESIGDSIVNIHNQLSLIKQ